MGTSVRVTGAGEHKSLHGMAVPCIKYAGVRPETFGKIWKVSNAKNTKQRQQKRLAFYLTGFFFLALLRAGTLLLMPQLTFSFFHFWETFIFGETLKGQNGKTLKSVPSVVLLSCREDTCFGISWRGGPLSA